MPPKRPTPRKLPEATAEENFAHLQPQALDMEKAVLAAIMLDSQAYGDVSEMLKPSSFYDAKHRIIYEAIQSLNTANRPIDVLTVPNQLKVMGQLEEAGGRAYISEICDSVSSSAHIEYHAAIVAQKALARELISYTSRIQTMAFDESTDVEEMMQKAEADLFELSKENVRRDYMQINPIVNQAYKELIAAAERKDGMTGIATHFTKLDELTNGWQKSNLIIIAARPAMGKTAFALSMAKNIAVDQRIPVGLFTLEMSNVELVNRIISNVCRIDSKKLRSAQLEPFEWEQLNTRIAALTDAPLYIDDTSGLTINEFRTKARRMVREQGVQLIMIDYLQLMTAGSIHVGSRQEEVSLISRHLKGMAKELNIPIIALSQVSRKVEERNNQATASGSEGSDELRRPQLSDLRESGSIEQDADLVLFLHRPEYYKLYKDNQGNDTRGKAEVIVAKHRNGEIGTVRLSFVGQFTLFQNLDDHATVGGMHEHELVAQNVQADYEGAASLPPGDLPVAPSGEVPY